MAVPDDPAGAAAPPAPPATDEVFARVYGELKQLARGFLLHERRDHTLQPTALVHEAYVRMSRLEPGRWSDRAAFFAVAARAMRRILVDHARRRAAAKREVQTVTLDPGMVPDSGSGSGSGAAPTVDLLALDHALDALARSQPQHARVVELHLFAGLSVRETAGVLGVTERTVYRQLRSARAWLSSELGQDHGDAEGGETVAGGAEAGGR